MQRKGSRGFVAGRWHPRRRRRRGEYSDFQSPEQTRVSDRAEGLRLGRRRAINGPRRSHFVAPGRCRLVVNWLEAASSHSTSTRTSGTFQSEQYMKLAFIPGLALMAASLGAVAQVSRRRSTSQASGIRRVEGPFRSFKREPEQPRSLSGQTRLRRRADCAGHDGRQVACFLPPDHLPTETTPVRDEGWRFPVAHDMNLEQMRELGLSISEPRSPQETEHNPCRRQADLAAGRSRCAVSPVPWGHFGAVTITPQAMHVTADGQRLLVVHGES